MEDRLPELIETDESWLFLCPDEAVRAVVFDFAVTVRSERTQARIELPFTLTDDDGSVQVDPEKPQYVDRIVRLRTVPLLEIEVEEQSGTLHLRFAGNRSIDVPTGGDYEAYSLTVAPGWMFVGMPSGGVAVWGPTAPESSGRISRLRRRIVGALGRGR